MFELPEFTTLARQVNETLAGKTIRRGSLSNSPHKFVWHNRTHEEFAELTAGQPCPNCGTTIEKVQYLGGACYLCPRCQI